ncbi:Putative 50S ribosomal protein L24e [Rhizopus microsporus]|nr:Putative 50S ribosomal protein L24e [Rhizopus microsporus]
MKLEICSFSGHRIYPAKGKTYVRVDSRLSSSSMKGITEEVQKKRSRRTVKHERAVVGASWDAIRAKRSQKPDARAAARQAAIAKSKEAKKAAANQAKVSKQQAKGFAPKAAATSR